MKYPDTREGAIACLTETTNITFDQIGRVFMDPLVKNVWGFTLAGHGNKLAGVIYLEDPDVEVADWADLLL